MTALPVFETRRLILRAVTKEDAPGYAEHFVDYEVIRYLAAHVPWPYPEGGVLDYIRTKLLPRQGLDLWTWGLFLKIDPGALIGAVMLWREGKPEN